MTNCLCAHWSIILVFIFLIAVGLGKMNTRNNYLMSASAVRHSSTYIILYITMIECNI